jgi:hypothetical protein
LFDLHKRHAFGIQDNALPIATDANCLACDKVKLEINHFRASIMKKIEASDAIKAAP